MLELTDVLDPRVSAQKESASARLEGGIQPVGKVVSSHDASVTEVQATVESVNEGLQLVQTGLRFKVDDASGRTIVNIVDKETDEVIRSIPSEDMLRIASRLREAIDAMSGGAGLGVLLDELA